MMVENGSARAIEENAMSIDSYRKHTSRREFLKGALAGTAGLAAGLALPTETWAQRSSPYAPFRVGIQSYSLRHFGVDDAMAKTQQLGLTNWEAYPDHLPITDDPKVIAEYKDKLRAHGLRLMAYGVVDFSNDEADARKKFEFAKAMNIPVLSAYPRPDSFSLLDKLVAEYNILIGIHNHGPGDNLYDTWEKVLAAIEGHDQRIGACDDTGHYLRVDVSPVTAALKFGPRLYDVHLKAVKPGQDGQKEFTDLDTPGSLLDTVGLLRQLQHSNYRHLVALEYEEHEDDPMPFIEKNLAALRRYCATIRDSHTAVG